MNLEVLEKDAPEAARLLVGRLLVRRLEDGRVLRARITQTEAYLGAGDSACHARFGRTARNAPMFAGAGTLYVYLCYGLHWMLNLVTGAEGDPQAVLIRGVEGAEGPGRVSRLLEVNGAMSGTRLGPALDLEDDGTRPAVAAAARVGIGYASAEDQARLWRFIAK